MELTRILCVQLLWVILVLSVVGAQSPPPINCSYIIEMQKYCSTSPPPPIVKKPSPPPPKRLPPPPPKRSPPPPTKRSPPPPTKRSPPPPIKNNEPPNCPCSYSMPAGDGYYQVVPILYPEASTNNTLRTEYTNDLIAWNNNETVHEGTIIYVPCSYMLNSKPGTHIANPPICNSSPSPSPTPSPSPKPSPSPSPSPKPSPSPSPKPSPSPSPKPSPSLSPKPSPSPSPKPSPSPSPTPPTQNNEPPNCPCSYSVPSGDGYYQIVPILYPEASTNSAIHSQYTTDLMEWNNNKVLQAGTIIYVPCNYMLNSTSKTQIANPPVCNFNTSPSSPSSPPVPKLPGRQSWAWVYTDWKTSLTAITSNLQSFTHVSPFFYSVNYDYVSGVAYYANCNSVSDNITCTGPGSNNFDGLTTQQITTQLTDAGLPTIPVIVAGADNTHGVDIGIQKILNNNNGEANSFILSMVQEAVNNKYAGYNIDWETGSLIDNTYADKFITFVNNFKKALNVHNMSLSADVIVNNILGTFCSGNAGYLDFNKLSSSLIDYVIIEDYVQSLGSPTTSCQNTILSSDHPIACDFTFTGELNLMCSNLPNEKTIIGIFADPSGTNPIADKAISAIESYGFNKIAVFPQIDFSTTYRFLDPDGLVSTKSNWYVILNDFLGF